MPAHVYQNERFYGLAWRPPALLERSNWSDEAGNSSGLREAPREGVGGWKVDINSNTDAEGWLYGSVFKHLDYPRPGGRAGRRAGDFVRRRRWVQAGSEADGSELHAIVSAAEHVTAAAEAAAKALISPVTQMQGAKLRKQTEIDRRKSALKMFLSMLTSTIKRRQLWSVMPMDPAAWYVLLTKHQADLLSCQAAALASAPSAPEMEPGRPQDLIRDLVCAAVHSRAAYGHAMAAGHLASLLNFALLATLQQFNFDPVGGASGQANNDAVAALAGIPPEDMKLAEWHNSIARPCHYLAVDRANRCIVLSIRGSLETGDILSDLTAKPLEMFGMLNTEGLVHEGMMAAATYVQCNTAPALEALAKTHQGWPLLITGHSMGGSVAAILAVLMRQGGAPPGLGLIRCIAIGPAPVFSHPLAEACRDFVTSVVLGADVVPRISYASVEALFLEFGNSSPIGNLGRKVTQTLEGFKAEWPSALKAPSLKAPSLPGIPGLQSLVGLVDSDEATARAVQAAESAAAALEAEEEHAEIELTHQERRESCREASSSGRSPARDAYSWPNPLSKAAERSAMQKLSMLRAQSEEFQQEEMARASKERGTLNPKPQGSLGKGSAPGEKVGQGGRASEDHETAAQVLGTRGGEFRDAAGHPEPLYVAGRVLWIIPPKEQQASSSVKPSEVQMTDPRTADKQEPSGRHSPGEQTANAASQSQQKEEPAEEFKLLPRVPAQKRPASAVLPGAVLRAGEGRRPQSFGTPAAEDAPSQDERMADVDAAPKRARSGEHKSLGQTLGLAPHQDAGGSASLKQFPAPKVLEMRREAFEKILLTTEMMQDHLPDSYLSAINLL